MREIILDTETTGLNPSGGDRIVEIGCVELFNHVATGKTYHQYVNPQRPMPEEAFKIHGLSNDFLAGFPIMSDVIDDFLRFVGKSTLVIHNAEFDLGFINSELERLKKPFIDIRNTIDTVKLARKKFPGASVSLDALCKRFQIDNSNRVLHGALLDADLLSSVYLELLGGKQPDLELNADLVNKIDEGLKLTTHKPRTFELKDEEKLAHAQFLKKLVNPVWQSE